MLGVTRRPMAACFGGGVVFGIAFDLGVAHALRDSGYPVDQGPMLGTSAGSWTAGALALDLTFDDMLAALPGDLRMRRMPRRLLRDIAREVFTDRRDARVSAVVIEVATQPRRRVLSGASHDLADIVAASSSLVGIVGPHRIGTRRFHDPGPFFMNSADLAPPADVLVVIAPITGRVLGVRGAVLERQLKLEMQLWRRRTGGHVLYIRPNAQVAQLAGRGISDLFDVERASEIYEASYKLGLDCVDRFELRHPELAAGVRESSTITQPRMP